MPAVLTAADARHWALLTRAALAARRTEIDAPQRLPGARRRHRHQPLPHLRRRHRRGRLGARGAPASSATPPSCRSAAPSSGPSCCPPAATPGSSSASSSAACATPSSSATPRWSTRRCSPPRSPPGPPRPGPASPTRRRAPSSPSRMPAPPPPSRPPTRGGSLADVCEAAVDAAQVALARTPDQLEALARAGVVDAGGAGCVLMLESFHRVVTGRWSATDEGLLSAGPPLKRRDEWRQPDAVPAANAQPSPTLTGHDPLDRGTEAHGEGPAYEVMYLLTDTTPEAVETLTGTLDGLGDSLLVVGGPDLWNVHVHVDDPGAAVEAGVAAGRPERIRITHFASQVDAREQPVPLAVVACAAGPGIGALLREAGAVVVASGPGRRASAGQLLEAVRVDRVAPPSCCCPATATRSWPPRSPPRRPPARASTCTWCPPARPCRRSAALAVLDPGRSVHANVVAMTGAAVATRHGAVSVATKEALTWAGVCHPGDVLGIVDGDVAFLGTDVAVAAREVLDRLLSAGGELVTLVVGADAERRAGRRRRLGAGARPPRARGGRHRRRAARLPPARRGGVSGGDLTWRPSRASSRRSSPRRRRSSPRPATSTPSATCWRSGRAATAPATPTSAPPRSARSSSASPRSRPPRPGRCRSARAPCSTSSSPTAGTTSTSPSSRRGATRRRWCPARAASSPARSAPTTSGSS